MLPAGAVILAALLAGGATSHGPGPARPREVGPFSVDGGLLAGAAMVGWTAPSDGTLTSIQFTETAAGSGTSMTYSVTVNGSPVCTITVACNSSGVQTQACDDVFSAGATLAVNVSADNCLIGNPAGNLMLTIQ